MSDPERIPYLLIGGSSAALSAVRGIRSVDPDGPIALVSRERDVFYSRPLLPYWLTGRVTADRMAQVAPGFCEANHVAPRLGAEVTRLDPAARTASLSEGSTIRFEKALIASGGRPIVPTGLETAGVEGVSTFATWDDARRVQALIERGGVEHAVVVGGGFTGVKTAQALAALGIGCTVVEMADRLLNAALDATVGALAQAQLERAGIRVRCGAAAAALQSHAGRLAGVTLRSGETLPCQLLLLAIGVVPDTRLVSGSGIAAERGILVDERLETSAPGIFAAGDVAQANDRLTGKSRPLPILSNARRQGFIAGVNMAGGAARFEGGVTMNAIEIGGLACMSIGLASEPGVASETLAVHDPRRGTYRKLVLQGDRLVGAILVGSIGPAGILAHLIREGISVAACKHRLLDDEVPLDHLPSAYWQRGVPAAENKEFMP